MGTGDATDLRATIWLEGSDESYGAVSDFGIVHHIPTWRAAVAEVARVLKSGGRFCYEEVTKHALDRRSYRQLFDHLKHDRFTPDDFIGELERDGMTMWGSRTVFYGDLLLGVAQRLT